MSRFSEIGVGSVLVLLTAGCVRFPFNQQNIDLTERTTARWTQRNAFGSIPGSTDFDGDGIDDILRSVDRETTACGRREGQMTYWTATGPLRGGVSGSRIGWFDSPPGCTFGVVTSVPHGDFGYGGGFFSIAYTADDFSDGTTRFLWFLPSFEAPRASLVTQRPGHLGSPAVVELRNGESVIAVGAKSTSPDEETCEVIWIDPAEFHSEGEGGEIGRRQFPCGDSLAAYVGALPGWDGVLVAHGANEPRLFVPFDANESTIQLEGTEGVPDGVLPDLDGDGFPEYWIGTPEGGWTVNSVGADGSMELLQAADVRGRPVFGDLDGDGAVDLIVGDPDMEIGGVEGAGGTSVFLGPGLLERELTLENADLIIHESSQLSREYRQPVDGLIRTYRSGSAVTHLGDITGNGVGDLAIGALGRGFEVLVIEGGEAMFSE